MIMSRVGRASARHLRRAAVVTLALAVPIAIGACGGGGHDNKTAAVKSPAQLVSESFSASDAVNSGKVSLALDLSLDGIKALGGKPIALDVSGPFQRGADGLSADLQATLSAASSSAKLAVVKVGKTVYLGLDGAYYQLIQGVKSIPLRSTPPTGATARNGASGLLGGLGIDPRSWLTDPHMAGTKTVGKIVTDHLSAQINVANVLGDLTRLIGGSRGATGATGAGNSTSLLPLVQSAVNSARVDIYTGVGDHIVREFDLAISFTVPSLAAGALDGLTGGSLHLHATLTDLGQPQTISAPAGAQPQSKLLNGVFALESKFGSLASLVASLTGTGGKGVNFGGLFSGSSARSTTTSTTVSASSSGG
jgi:hypothetical protein